MPRMRKSGNYSEFSGFHRGLIVRVREAGLSFRKIAEKVHTRNNFLAYKKWAIPLGLGF